MTVFLTTDSSFKILFQCAMNDSLTLAGKPAIRVASGSSWCSKKKGRSSLSKSRSTTPVKALLASLATYSSPPAREHVEPLNPRQDVSGRARPLDGSVLLRFALLGAAGF